MNPLFEVGGADGEFLLIDVTEIIAIKLMLPPIDDEQGKPRYYIYLRNSCAVMVDEQTGLLLVTEWKRSRSQVKRSMRDQLVYAQPLMSPGPWPMNMPPVQGTAAQINHPQKSFPPAEPCDHAIMHTLTTLKDADPNCPSCAGSGLIDTTTDTNTRFKTARPCPCRETVDTPKQCEHTYDWGTGEKVQCEFSAGHEGEHRHVSWSWIDSNRTSEKTKGGNPETEAHVREMARVLNEREVNPRPPCVVHDFSNGRFECAMCGVSKREIEASKIK